jgi:carbon monoxide dehydrogenase subunit G
MTRTLLLVVLVALTGAGAAHAAPAPDVTVQEKGGVFTVTAQFAVAAPPAAVLAVLSDYERIPQFMPGVKRSVVKERQGSHAVVEQEAVSRVMLFSKRVHLLLDIHEQPESLAFHDTCGASFHSYNGSWRVVPSADGSTVVYTLSAAPAFDVPGFMLTRLLKRDSVEMIDSLQKEVASRTQQRP